MTKSLGSTRAVHEAEAAKSLRIAQLHLKKSQRERLVS